MQPNSNIAAFFDFDETLIDNDLLTRGYLFKVMLTGCLYKIRLLSEKRMADSLITFYKNKQLYFFASQADKFYNDLLKPRLVKKVLERLEYHKKKGHLLVIVSGSIRYYLEPVAKDLGFHHIVCTDLEEGPDGLLTGKPIGQICINDYKKELTLKLVEKENIDLKNSYAYGNNEADIPFLKLVGNPIAVEPSPKLRKVALKNNWTILQYR